MDELDLLQDPDDARTAPMTPVPREPLEATGAFPGVAGGPPGTEPGVHRKNGPQRPWAWLVAVLAAALLAVAGLVWMIGAAVGDGARAPVAVPPSATLSLHPSPTMPLDTSTAVEPTPTATPPLTVTPAPSVTTVLPTPRPTPRQTTPEPSATGGFVQVPSVVGDRVRAATRELERLGLTVSVVPAGGGRDGQRVIAQQPSGGRVPRGSTVVLLVGGAGGG